MAFASPDLGIDLGTINTRIYVKSKGILIDEPSLVLQDRSHRRAVRSFGAEAYEMMGRTGDGAQTVHPFDGRSITDFDNLGYMLKYFVRKAVGNSHILASRAVITIAGQLSAADRENLADTAHSAGIRARHLSLISKPLAAALGAQLPVFDPVGSMIVDIGGGTTEAAVLSLGGVVACSSINASGEKMTENIVNYIKRTYNADISMTAAEDIKFALGTALPAPTPQRVQVRAHDMINNLPQDIIITSTDVYNALEGSCAAIADLITHVLAKTPPELCADVLRNGIVLTGGGAKLFALREYISSELHLPVSVAGEPLNTAALGVGTLIDQPLLIEKISKTGFLEIKGD